MHRIATLCLGLGVGLLSTPAAHAQQTPQAPHEAGQEATRPVPGAETYPAPDTMEEVLRWSRVGFWHVQREGDPRSPRHGGWLTEPEERAATPGNALAVFVRRSGLRLAAPPRFERLEAWRRANGTEMHAGLVETSLGGAAGVAFVLVARQPRDGGQWRVVATEAPRETFVAWDGVVRMMRLRGEIPSVDAFPTERRTQIARAPLDQQLALYEAVLDQHHAALAMGLLGSQLALTQMMTQLNYNLLFGRPLLSPPR